jgi:syntaxin 1B/2/3
MGSARNALKEVQSRAEDIKRIEQTISELAQMFNDVRKPSLTSLFLSLKKKKADTAVNTCAVQKMATMVEEQDVKVQHIEKQAEIVNQDVEAA